MTSATRRLFVGLPLVGEVAERLVLRVRPALLDAQGRPSRGVRPYPARDLHLTLAFLGDFPEAGRADLQHGLRQELRGLDAPELCLSGTGAFPDRRRPRVLWAGVEEQARAAGRLVALRDRVWRGALARGWRPARAERDPPFRPHVTLARVRPGARVPPAFFELGLDQRWLPVEALLLESRVGRPAARYEALAALPLAVRPG